MTLRYSTDIVIFGGGIAGLWLLNRLKSEGYHAILLEQDELGGGQTLASQGIIHGGLKYALNGVLTGATNTIAGMPKRWRECLEGNDSVDLRGTELLSEQYFMWSNSGVRSRLKTFLGSKSLRGKIEAVEKPDYPEFFKQATVKGSLYKLPDFVISTESLLEALKKGHKESIFGISDASIEFDRDSENDIVGVELNSAKGAVSLDCQKVIFCAGSGNEALIEQAGLRTISCQRRPLNMVFVKGPHLPPLFVHCIGDSFNLTPRLTVTSHSSSEEQTVWYLGGEIAESGTNKSKDEQLNSAQELVAELFPWLEQENLTWDCFSVDRAEPAVNSNFRPDDAYLAEESNILVAWPTKLTLAPALGDKVIKQLQKSSITPNSQNDTSELLKILKQPRVGTAQWN
ncbi:MAG: FAD-dependent oxidoreductase [Pseudohongiellaceae bacterium]